ncbi:MAG: hypothetical protein RL375_3374, partial [Pseudomonadota bacterium]
DVNLFHGRLGHAPGGSSGNEEVSYVRPHELEVLGAPQPDTVPVTLSQALTVGPSTRLEFKREDGSYVDVELPRARWHLLRDQLGLSNGSPVWLKARRVTRFVAGTEVHAEVAEDPAAAI